MSAYSHNGTTAPHSTELTIAVSTIAFDLDGTLTDTSQLYLEAKVATLQSFSVHVTPDIKHLLSSGLSEKAIIAQVASLTGINIPTDEYNKVYVEKTCALVRQRNIPIAKGAERFLALLQKNGTQIAIASNGQERSARAILDATGLNAYFPNNHIITSSMEGMKRKPDPIMLMAAQDLTLGANASSAGMAYIGDKADDMHAALACNAIAIGIMPFQSSPDRAAKLARAGARYIASDFDDLSITLCMVGAKKAQNANTGPNP